MTTKNCVLPTDLKQGEVVSFSFCGERKFGIFHSFRYGDDFVYIPLPYTRPFDFKNITWSWKLNQGVSDIMIIDVPTELKKEIELFYLNWHRHGEMLQEAKKFEDLMRRARSNIRKMGKSLF